MFLKRVNAHAERREQSTSVLETFPSIPQLSETRIKSGRSVLCPVIFYLSIGVQYFVKFGAKIQNNFRYSIIILPKNDFEGIEKGHFDALLNEKFGNTNNYMYLCRHNLKR